MGKNKAGQNWEASFGDFPFAPLWSSSDSYPTEGLIAPASQIRYPLHKSSFICPVSQFWILLGNRKHQINLFILNCP